MFVAGFVSSAEKWSKFGTQWKALLKKYGIDPPFHMTDFMSKTGKYENWQTFPDEKRRLFLFEAIRTIKRNTRKSFAIGILQKELEKAKREYMFDLLEEPAYVWCGMSAIKKAMQWMERHGVHHNDIELIFEKGDLKQHNLEEAAFKTWKILPIFRPNADLVPFQAADFLGVMLECCGWRETNRRILG